MIKYKGYIGAVDFDPEIDLFHGRVINTNDVITFYGASVAELRKEMQTSIEGYIEFCKEQGKIMDKPFSGKFTIQINPETHCKLALNAERLHLDFNVYLQDVSEKAAAVVPNPNPVDVIDNPPEKRPVTVLPESDVDWTVDTVRKSLSKELRGYYEKTYHEEKLKLFYGGVAGLQNLIQKTEWRLNPPKLSKMLCGFWLTDKGVMGRIQRIFGILPQGRFAVEDIVDKNGKLIPRSPIIPRLFVRINKKEAEQLALKYDRCKFCGVSKDKLVDWIYYDIPEDMSILLPVFGFAYNKHTDTNY